MAGGDWPDRARRAAEILNAERDGSTIASDRVRLLTDCRTAFGSHDAIPTTVLLERLKADPEAPWADYGNTGLTAMKLGVMLREYEIRSTTIRFALPHGQAKGYTRSDFQDAWTRYCPPLTPTSDREPSQPYQPSQSSPTPGLHPWYGSSRTRDTTRTTTTPPKRARIVRLGRLKPYHPTSRPRSDLRWDGWYGLPEPVPRQRR